MKKLITLFVLVSALSFLRAQTAPDFTFTDIHGETHQLQHALDQGFIVMLDFFFVNCPPCQDSAPEIRSIYDDYQGKNLVIWSISDRDSDAAIEGFEANFNLEHISGGSQGGGQQIIYDLYAAQFPFTGFPTISIICPNGDLSWDIWPYSPGAPQWRNAIDACGVTDSDPYQSLTTSVQDLSYLLAEASLAPNPAGESTQLRFDLTEATPVTIELQDATGRLVRQVYQGDLPAGAHTRTLSLKDLPTGLYTVRISSQGQLIRTLKVMH